MAAAAHVTVAICSLCKIIISKVYCSLALEVMLFS